MLTAEYYIKELNLLAHPEGGYYRETYRSTGESIFKGFEGTRSFSTAIYFLLKDAEKSHLHKIKSDELWFFHAGDPIEILILIDQKLQIVTLGSGIEKGEMLQCIVPAGAWFGARVKGSRGFALVSCTVAPGFDFIDFELAEHKKISQDYLAYDSIVKEMCIK